MSNEILWIVLLFTSFAGILISYRLFGKVGLYAWTAISIVIANIQVLMTIKVFGFVTALGNIIYGSTFLVTDILCENHGKEEAKKAVNIGFFIMISVTVIMQICLLFIPDKSDNMREHIASIFGLFLPILVASLSAYISSQYFDVWFYNKIKEKTKGKYLWLRNKLSTSVSQLLDNVIFTGMFFVVYFIVFEPEGFLGYDIVLSIFVTSYVMKFVVSVLDTPFLYAAKRMKSKIKD